MSLTQTCCQDRTSVNGLQLREATVAPGFVLWGQSVDPVSEEDCEKIAAALGLLVIPLSLLGIPSNIISAVVFYKQGLRERINLCLFTLAIADLIVVLELFFQLLENQTRDLFLPHPWFFTTIAPCLNSFAWASTFLSAVIASERCFCVVSPFHAKRLLKTSTMAAIIVVCCFILVSGMCATVGPKYMVVDLFDPLTNTSKETLYTTRYYLDNKSLLDIFDIFVYSTCFPGIFLLVIAVTTFITVIKLRSAVSIRKNLTAKDKNLKRFKSSLSLSSKEVTVTRMLIGTSVLFIVCLTPNVVVQVTSFLVPDLSVSGKFRNLTVVIWSFISFLRVVNCSVNLWVYYILGSNFRHVLHEMCRNCCCLKQNKLEDNLVCT